MAAVNDCRYDNSVCVRVLSPRANQAATRSDRGKLCQAATHTMCVVRLALIRRPRIEETPNNRQASQLADFCLVSSLFNSLHFSCLLFLFLRPFGCSFACRQLSTRQRASSNRLMADTPLFLSSERADDDATAAARAIIVLRAD